MLVRLLGISNVEIYSSNVDESTDAALSPDEIVLELALRKSRLIAKQLTAQERVGVVLGADTLVYLNNRVLNKPTDEADAKRMLRELSTNTHQVFTGVALIDLNSGTEESWVVTTSVTFRELADDEINSYVASGSPLDKAGAYGIQEDFGAVFVSHIEGDYYNVVGLPISSLYVRLRAFAPELFASKARLIEQNREA
jgi:septum formation protein